MPTPAPPPSFCQKCGSPVEPYGKGQLVLGYCGWCLDDMAE